MDFFGGGGLKIPAGNYNQEMVNLYKKATEEGFTVTATAEEFHNLVPESLPVIAMAPGLTRDAALPYAIDMREGDLTLADFTAKGIELLDNENGFFMMVEGGKIDWASHSNDLARTVAETVEFDRAVEVGWEWARSRGDTLIVVTADHETGGLELREVNGKMKMVEVKWGTTGHSGIDVPVYAWGARADWFGERFDNTEMFEKIMEATGLGNN